MEILHIIEEKRIIKRKKERSHEVNVTGFNGTAGSHF